MAEEDWIKTGRKFTIPPVEARRSRYDNDEAERQDYERYRQPFLFPEFSPNEDFYLGPGLTLIGAKTGQGKTTLLANILAGFLRYRLDTVAVVVLNEEKGGSLLQRIACVLLEKSFPRFFFGRMPAREEEEIKTLARDLVSRVVVVDADPYDTNCLEDVKTVITGSPAAGASLILLDYLQNVNFSRDFPTMEAWKVSKDLGFFLKEYGRNHKVPIGVFVQLKTESDSKEFKERVENDKHIANHAYNCVEIRPDKETGMTTFQVWKQRWAFDQQYKVVLRYDGGRYVREVGL